MGRRLLGYNWLWILEQWIPPLLWEHGGIQQRLVWHFDQWRRERHKFPRSPSSAELRPIHGIRWNLRRLIRECPKWNRVAQTRSEPGENGKTQYLQKPRQYGDSRKRPTHAQLRSPESGPLRRTKRTAARRAQPQPVQPQRRARSRQLEFSVTAEQCHAQRTPEWLYAALLPSSLLSSSQCAPKRRWAVRSRRLISET